MDERGHRNTLGNRLNLWCATESVFIRAIILLLVFLSLQDFCIAGGNEFPLEFRGVINNPANLQQIVSVSNLPPEMVALCEGGKAGVADPGCPWNDSDAIKEPALPARRLIWAVKTNDIFVVHYESGGFTPGKHVFLAKKESDGTVKLLWSSRGDLFKNFSAFALKLKRRNWQL